VAASIVKRLKGLATSSWGEKRAALTWRLQGLRDGLPNLRTRARSRKNRLPPRLNRYRLTHGLRLIGARAAARGFYRDREPLVSVLIPTHNRARLLADRSLASVLQQTYSRVEIVVVGDGCTDDTASMIARIGDPRIRFENLPARGHLPEDPELAWLVAGTAAANRAATLARGQWFAWLDDDDEFSKDHIEILLEACLNKRWEFAYGIMEMEVEPEVWKPVGAFPPHLGEICNASVLYARYLRFLRYDPEAWRNGEPGDWNLWKRMWGAGVRMGFVDAVVGRHYLEHRPPLASRNR
jgi:glycosyltransferase involved in cell wall biosynthesis